MTEPLATRSFRCEEEYEASLERVYALLVDADVQRDKAIFLGAEDARCERLATGELRLIETRRPRRLRRALLGSGAVESVITLHADPSNACVRWSQRQNAVPVEVDGVIELSALSPRRCRLVFRGEVRARLRLVGSLVVRGVVRAIVEAKRREHVFYRERLGC